jgi:uncharacterized membrane protein (UPF0127 family)
MTVMINSRTKKVIVQNLEIANSMKTRLVGLIGRKTLSAGEGMLIKRSGNSIHTCFMKFAIDVAFVTKSGEVVYIKENIKPWRMVVAPLLKSTDCLELPAGTLKQNDTQIGDMLRVEN